MTLTDTIKSKMLERMNEPSLTRVAWMKEFNASSSLVDRCAKKSGYKLKFCREISVESMKVHHYVGKRFGDIATAIVPRSALAASGLCKEQRLLVKTTPGRIEFTSYPQEGCVKHGQ